MNGWNHAMRFADEIVMWINSHPPSRDKGRTGT